MERAVAVITGAGSGIGKAAAVALARDGWHVWLAGRREESLRHTATLIDREGSEAVVAPTDLSKPTDIESLFGRIGTDSPRLDLLFNNAGVGARAVPVEELTIEEWNAVVAVNLTASFLCAQHAVRIMKRQTPCGGRIINNGSVSAHTPRPNSAPYTATKHAITGLTKSLALDGRPFNITCGQIDIGNASTPMTARAATGLQQASGAIEPEPTMDVDDVGRAVAYMASLPPDANVLTMTVMANAMPYVGRG